jgi:hypothetical protein
MNRKLNLVAGTVLTMTLFLVFHAVLAVTTVCCFIFLIPAMLLRWPSDSHKEAPVRGAGLPRPRL